MISDAGIAQQRWPASAARAVRPRSHLELFKRERLQSACRRRTDRRIEPGHNEERAAFDGPKYTYPDFILLVSGKRTRDHLLAAAGPSYGGS